MPLTTDHFLRSFPCHHAGRRRLGCGRRQLGTNLLLCGFDEKCFLSFTLHKQKTLAVVIFKQIYIQVTDEERQFDATSLYEFRYSITKASRYICNYLERECLKKLRFRTEGFNRIVIGIAEAPDNKMVVNSEAAACLEVKYNKRQLSMLAGLELTDQLIAYIRRGLNSAASFISIPEEELNVCLNKFIAEGYKNEWIHQKKTFRSKKVEAVLACCLSQDRFTLRLVIQKEGKTVFNRQILKTDPDEIAFHYRFNAIELIDDSIVITTKHSKPLKTVSI